MVSEIALLRVGYGFLNTCSGGFDRVGDWVGRRVCVKFAIMDSGVVIDDKSSDLDEEGGDGFALEWDCSSWGGGMMNVISVAITMKILLSYD